MVMSAFIVVKLLRVSTRIGNIVLVLASLMLVERMMAMDKEKFDSILLYKTTMAMAKTMLKNGLISAEEYTEIDTIIAKKYGLDLSVIYR